MLLYELDLLKSHNNKVYMRVKFKSKYVVLTLCYQVFFSQKQRNLSKLISYILMTDITEAF